MSKSLLFVEHPLVVNVPLAQSIGLNEAIVLQQIAYWLKSSKHEHEGKLWVYNTYEQWCEQFPFWSERTIRRIVKSLEDHELVETTAAFNRQSFDRTKWYTINLDHELLSVSDRCGQTGRTEPDKVAASSGQNGQLFNRQRLATETTAETTPPAPPEPKKTTSVPYQIFEAVCEEQGADPTEMPPSHLGRHLAFGKKLAADGMTEADARRMTQWLMLTQTWLTSGVEVKTLYDMHSKWVAKGKPDGAAANVTSFPALRYGKDIGRSTEEQKRRHFERFGVAL